MQVQEKICMVDGGVAHKTYKKIKDIGSGSFSKVWLVEAVGSNSLYALKIITKKQMKVLENERLVEEVKVHQSLVHPHIVYLDHCFEDEDYKYILLQYCEKGTLDNLFGDKPVEEEEIRKYGKQMIEALTYLQSKGILHRDLKLSNFFVDGDDNIKLGDFGFACKLQYPGQLRRETCGTPNYIAPQVIGGFGYSFPSDVWSLGAILYRLKFGHSPFEAASLKETLQNVKLANYSFPKKIKVSNDLQQLITKILCVNYDDRYTLDQILKHRFFSLVETPQLKKQNSFRNFFSNLLSRSKSKSKKQLSIHKVDSCNNLRDMKTILRQKTSTIDEDVYYSGFRHQIKSSFLSPQHRSSAYLSKPPKQIPKTKSLFVTHFYPGVVAHEIVQQKQYTIVYLTNGLRQIIYDKTTCIISSDDEYFSRQGKRCELNKIMQYIVKTYLKRSPMNCVNVKQEISCKNFITEWKIIGQYLSLSIGAAVMIALPLQKLIYLYLKQTSYLYNRSLQIVSNQTLLNKLNKIYNTGRSQDMVRLKSPASHKRLI